MCLCRVYVSYLSAILAMQWVWSGFGELGCVWCTAVRSSPFLIAHQFGFGCGGFIFSSRGRGAIALQPTGLYHPLMFLSLFRSFVFLWCSALRWSWLEVVSKWSCLEVVSRLSWLEVVLRLVFKWVSVGGHHAIMQVG